MKISQLLMEAVSEEAHKKYEKWKDDCKKADANCTFVGGIGGSQAVNWIDPGNKVVGDWEWDGKEGTPHVYHNAK